MDLSEYRYTQSDHDSWFSQPHLYAGNQSIAKRMKRVVYIRKNFNSYEGIMNTLSILGCIEHLELDDIFFCINKIVTQLSTIEIVSILKYLKQNMSRNDQSVYLSSYLHKIDELSVSVIHQIYEHIKLVKNEILLTGFISHDVMVNVLFEYICYKKLTIYFLIFAYTP